MEVITARDLEAALAAASKALEAEFRAELDKIWAELDASAQQRADVTNRFNAVRAKVKIRFCRDPYVKQEPSELRMMTLTNQTSEINAPKPKSGT